MSEDYEQAADAAEQELGRLEAENEHLGEEIDGARKAKDDAYADQVIADPKQDFGVAADAPVGEEDDDEVSIADEVEAAQDQAAAEAEEETPDQAA